MRIDNKGLMQDVFAELAKGNQRPFAETMAEDICWTIAGSSAWSRTWRGKKVVLSEL